MIARWNAWLRRCRRWLRRSERSVQLLRLPRRKPAETEPGLLLIQIDGLPRTQLEIALQARRMPFLCKLMRREHYRLHTFYSGLPSSTPAVQGELFYGYRCAVPGFSFRDHETGRIARMFEPESASTVENRIGKAGQGLLDGGSAYCNIYGGGAAESHFCASTIGWDQLVQNTSWIRLASVVLWNVAGLFRIVWLSFVELGLAIVDFFRGLAIGQDLRKELKFVPSRVAVSIMLRELAVIGATWDMARGLPIVHLNLLGYDEQAHRRGPTSAFAHWALKGIDGAIRRLWDEAHDAPRRHYDVWVFSDHGQEETIPYPSLTGHTLAEALVPLFQSEDERVYVSKLIADRRGVQSTRAGWLGQGRMSRWLRRLWERSDENGQQVQIAAMGPLAHVYPPREFDEDRKQRLAERIATEAQVPLVLMRAGAHKVRAVTPRGTFLLPDEAADVFGSGHPLCSEVAQDMLELVYHPSAGSFVLSGWRPDGKPISFPEENGAHGGPGSEETRGFALLPKDAPLPETGASYVRPGDLRNAALHLLRRDVPSTFVVRTAPERKAQRLRIMTYNVHSCIGMDGRLSPERIARVIGQADVDVVALQELDVGRMRTGEVDQAHRIAEVLAMDFHFNPALQVEEELYGDAVLSRVPMHLVRCGPLPQPNAGREPRGALWVELAAVGRTIQFLNTHLGLGRAERQAQVEALLGEQWVGHRACHEPVILCGDFNALPPSQAYRRLCSVLNDAQRQLNGHRPLATWLSGRPINRIDHVFLGGPMHVVKVEVPRNNLARIASDHLPLIVELEFDATPGGT